MSLNDDDGSCWLKPVNWQFLTVSMQLCWIGEPIILLWHHLLFPLTASLCKADIYWWDIGLGFVVFHPVPRAHAFGRIMRFLIFGNFGHNNEPRIFGRCPLAIISVCRIASVFPTEWLPSSDTGDSMMVVCRQLSVHNSGPRLVLDDAVSCPLNGDHQGFDLSKLLDLTEYIRDKTHLVVFMLFAIEIPKKVP